MTASFHLSHFDIRELGLEIVACDTNWSALHRGKGNPWLGSCAPPNPDLSSLSGPIQHVFSVAKGYQKMLKLPSTLSFSKNNFRLSIKIAPVKTKWSWARGGKERHRHIIKRTTGQEAPRDWNVPCQGPRGSISWTHDRHKHNVHAIFPSYLLSIIF
jgi:hypothetical protein